MVFDFTSKVIDFFTVFPKQEDGKDAADGPDALVVLAEEEIVAIDLTHPEWKMMALPYLVSLHASAVSIHFDRLISVSIFKDYIMCIAVSGYLFAACAKRARRTLE